VQQQGPVDQRASERAQRHGPVGGLRGRREGVGRGLFERFFVFVFNVVESKRKKRNSSKMALFSTRIELVLALLLLLLAHLERLGQVLLGLERRDEGVGVVGEGLGRRSSSGGRGGGNASSALFAHLETEGRSLFSFFGLVPRLGERKGEREGRE